MFIFFSFIASIFTDEEMEIQKSEVSWPGSHSLKEAEPGSDSKSGSSEVPFCCARLESHERVELMAVLGVGVVCWPG